MFSDYYVLALWQLVTTLVFFGLGLWIGVAFTR